MLTTTRQDNLAQEEWEAQLQSHTLGRQRGTGETHWGGEGNHTSGKLDRKTGVGHRLQNKTGTQQGTDTGKHRTSK